MKFLPFLRREIFEPVLSWRAGSPKLAYWRELEQTQYLAEQQLKEIQWRRLLEMIQYAYENNSFYRGRFDAYAVKPREIKNETDLHRIPVLTKHEIRSNTDRMISQGLDANRLLKFKTGGSTGKALELFITESCSELRNACARRHDRWTGWESGEPVGALWGNPPIADGLKGRLKAALVSPTIYLDTMQFTEQSVIRFAEQWSKVGPTLLFGHSHSIYLLAMLVRDLSIHTIRPKAIISTSMMLLPHERKLIEQVFGVRVFDRYGCEEVSLIASECERHEGLHLNIEHLLIEFLRDDGQQADPGEEGRIVVTDLMNKAMPFIRYEVEDIGVPSGRRCSCGRGLPLMEKVTGRVADFLVKSDGTRVAGVSLIENTLTKIPGIDQMQIIQESLEVIELNVVPGVSFTNDTSSNLIAYFGDLFQGDIQVKVHLVPSIAQEPSGKYRFSICNLRTS